MNWTRWAQLSAFTLLAVACASRAGGSDSETHFVCRVDEECTSRLGDEYGCVERECQRLVAQDAGITASRDAAVDVVQPVRGFADASTDSRGTSPPIVPQDGALCVSVTRQPELIRQNLYVLLDQSIDMANPVGASSDTWWQLASDAIVEFASSPIAEGAVMAMQYFPLGAAPDSCSAAYDLPALPLTTLPNDWRPIRASLQAHSPGGLSTAGPALQGGIDYLKAFGTGRAGEQFKVVLITSGAPLQCDPKTASEIANIAASGLTGEPRVETYVIALDQAASVFNPVAAAGGSSQAFSVSGGDVQRALGDSFYSILGVGMECEVDLGFIGDTRSSDPEHYNVSFALTDILSTMVFHVAQAADCATQVRNGWYFDDAAAPTKIILCPDLCAHPPSHKFTIAYDCL